MREHLGWAAALALALALLVATPLAASGTSAPAAGPGCTGLAAPIAHRSGGVLVTPPPAGGPRACGVSTGFAAAESHIVAMNDGAVVYVPAVVPSGVVDTGGLPPVGPDTQGNDSPGAMAVTTDSGGHWSLVKPFGITWNPTDHGDYVDPATGRLFFEDYGPIPLAPEVGVTQEGPAHMMWTDDRTSWHHAVIPNLVLPENPRFAAGAPPAGQPGPTGYPNVVYFCANTNVGFTSPAILGRLCFRSLDGGSTWAQTSQLFNALAPQHPECGGSGETFTAIDGYYPEATSDGFLYLLMSCGGKTYLARSTDEGATFPVVHGQGGPVTVDAPVESISGALGSGPQLRIGPDDTFYLAYPQLAGNSIHKLVLRASRDRGITWSAPEDVTAPGVARILRWTVTERGAGQLAFGYLGQRAGQTTWDAYVTATRDGRGASPLFWSGVTNTQPLLFGDSIEGAGYIVGQGQVAVPFPFPLGIQPLAGAVEAGNDFMGVTIGPDGSAWASFDQDCGPTPDSSGCQADKDQTRGFVGRLVWPGGATPSLPAGRAAAPSSRSNAEVGPRELAATGASPLLPMAALGLAALALALTRVQRGSSAVRNSSMTSRRWTRRVDPPNGSRPSRTVMRGASLK